VKKNEKILTYFGDPLCKKYFFFIARGIQLDNGVDSPCFACSDDASPSTI
jgi:hypothetical protein